MAKYIKGGLDVVQHLAGADITVDDVVVLGPASGKKATVGVAMNNIASGERGSVACQGVFELPKTATAVITAGAAVNWDVSEGSVDAASATPAAGDVVEFGKAMADGANGETTILVDIGYLGTVQ